MIIESQCQTTEFKAENNLQIISNYVEWDYRIIEFDGVYYSSKKVFTAQIHKNSLNRHPTLKHSRSLYFDILLDIDYK